MHKTMRRRFFLRAANPAHGEFRVSEGFFLRSDITLMGLQILGAERLCDLCRTPVQNSNGGRLYVSSQNKVAAMRESLSRSY